MRALVCVCVCARLCVNVCRVGRGLCGGGNPLFPRGRITWSCPGKLLPLFLFTCLLCGWMFSVFYWKTTKVAAGCLSSKCLQTPAKRGGERIERERGRRKRERDRGARYITLDTSVHAQISRTCFPPSSFLNFQKRRILIPKWFFGQKIVVMIYDWQL